MAQNKLHRRQDWAERLAVYLRGQRGKPFVWGSNDCGLFTCGAIEAMTGVDLAAPLRGSYNDEAGAAKAMLQFCGGNIEKAAEKIAAEYSLAEIMVLMAQRGDVVLFDSPLGPALGFVGHDGWRVRSIGPAGPVALLARKARRAWRIG